LDPKGAIWGKEEVSGNMSPLIHLCQWLHDSAIGTSIRESTYAFPIIETAHVLGITLLVGTIAVVDLRLLGILFRRERVSSIVRQVLPLTWSGFVVMFVSGFLLFWSEAEKAYVNPVFRIKLLLLLLVGLNPLIFHSTIYRRVAAWDDALVAPLQARVTAVLSLTLWSATIVAGRAIAYFH
jgi:hypothetical protein